MTAGTTTRLTPTEIAPDRHGNTNFSDRQQIEFFDWFLKHEGFGGTDRERAIIAEAWWMGDWEPKGRCPSLAEAKAFLRGDA